MSSYAFYIFYLAKKDKDTKDAWHLTHDVRICASLSDSWK